MGAYLSQPKTEKFSTDEVNDLLMVGASSMQGWRNSQEDAHNCILNFDTSTSFFAVYDGHGGAEVANYCADKLPHFLKDSAPYKGGQLEKALKSAFLDFDKTLLDAEVVEVLKILAGEKNFVEDSDVMEEDEDDEDLAELREEGNLPLDEVLEKYKGGASMPALKKVKDCEPRPSGSKPQSPYLRGRRAAAVAADAANKAEIDAEINAQSLSNCSTSNDNAAGTSKSTTLPKGDTGSAEDDSTVSSSSSGVCKSNNNNNNNSTNNNTAMVTSKEAEAEAEASEPQKATTNGCATSSLPDSSHIKDSEQNGNVTSSESKTLKEVVSTSTNEQHCVKSAIEDDIVSGSNEATENEQNGNVDNSTASSSAPMKSIEKTDLSAISSTSKDSKKMKKSSLDDDSTDEDVDFDVDDASSNEDVDPHHSLDYSSDEEGDDDDEDEDDDDVDDGDDEEDDDDEDEDDENILSGDQLCTSMIEEPGKDSGCTAVVALLRGRDLYVANAGDSRCVVARKGKAIEMSLDHKPEDEEESARIVKAGGRVTLDGRVNGGLNLSRALGDHAYKMNYDLSPEEQMISALPDIKKLIITPEDEFMVLACDGIWNFMSSEEVVEFVRSRLVDDTKKLSQICEDLFDNCLAPNTMGDGTGCDNMTAVIVRFQEKLLEMPTEINVNETEDVLVSKKSAAEADGEMSGQKTLKRCASPNSDDSCNEAENVKTKRAKTDDELGELQTSSSNDATSSSSSSVSKSTHADAEQSECDSLNTVNNEATAAALST